MVQNKNEVEGTSPKTILIEYKGEIIMFNVELNGTVSQVETIREVCEVLGTKVSKKEVMEGRVAGVTLTNNVPKVVEMPVIDTEEISPVEEIETAIEEVPVVEEETPTTVEDIPVTVEEVSAVEEPVALVEEPTPPLKSVIPASEAAKPIVAVVPNSKPIAPLNKPVDAPKESLDVLRAKLQQVYAKKVAEDPTLGKKPKEVKPKYDLSIREYPEKGSFETEDGLKEFYQKLSDAQLAEWMQLEGIEYKHSDNVGINRMRMAMALTNYHFPKVSMAKKKKSKYGDYTTEDLVAMAIENNIAIKDDRGDMRILRMYTIMGLKEAGILE